MKNLELTKSSAVGYNSGSIGIAYIGNFNMMPPNDAQLNAGFLLMQEGVRLKKLSPNKDPLIQD